MANNRMFLVHPPSGLAIFLGKRMGWGWYSYKDDDIDDRLNKFYETLEKHGYIGKQDAFCLAMEDNSSGNALVITKWKYADERSDGFSTLIIDGAEQEAIPDVPKPKFADKPKAGLLSRLLGLLHR